MAVGGGGAMATVSIGNSLSSWDVIDLKEKRSILRLDKSIHSTVHISVISKM